MSIKGLLCSASIAAVLGACAPVPGPSMPVRYAQTPAYYNYNPRPPYVPPSQLNQVPVAPSPSWQNSLGPMATGAAVGGIGGVMANRALSGAESHAVDEAGTVVEREAAHTVEKSVATSAADSLVVRGVGAAALTAVEDAEAAEIAEFIFTRLIWLAL